MSADYIQAKLDPTIKTVSVTFGGDNRYTYKTRIPFQPNDLGLVRVKHEVKVVKITEIHDEPRFDTSLKYQWIFQKVERSSSKDLEKEDARFRSALEAKNTDGERRYTAEQLQKMFFKPQEDNFPLSDTEIML